MGGGAVRRLCGLSGKKSGESERKGARENSEADTRRATKRRGERRRNKYEIYGLKTRFLLLLTILSSYSLFWFLSHCLLSVRWMGNGTEFT